MSMEDVITKRRKVDTLVYKIFDFISAMLAWGAFFIYRKSWEGNFSWDQVFDDPNFYKGIFIIPIGWLLIYFEYTDTVP